MKKDLLAALKILLALTIVTGAAYPAATTGLAALLFAHRAAGSPALAADAAGEKVVGSELIGQSFTGRGYFWGRPSATPGGPYSPALSSGSNLAASNPALAEQAGARLAALLASDPAQQAPVPADLIAASGSGLDPDISLEAARWQTPRVALARGFTEAEVSTLIASQARHRRLTFLGEPRVNVLELNLTLDRLSAQRPPPGPAAPAAR